MMHPQRFCSHPAATATPASSLLLASPTQHPHRHLETASGGGFKGRWGEKGDRATKLLSHPSPIPPKGAERNSSPLSQGNPRGKNNFCQLRRDAEGRSAGTGDQPRCARLWGTRDQRWAVQQQRSPSCMGNFPRWKERSIFISSPPRRRCALSQRAGGEPSLPQAHNALFF